MFFLLYIECSVANPVKFSIDRFLHFMYGISGLFIVFYFHIPFSKGVSMTQLLKEARRTDEVPLPRKYCDRFEVTPLNVFGPHDWLLHCKGRGHIEPMFSHRPRSVKLYDTQELLDHYTDPTGRSFLFWVPPNILGEVHTIRLWETPLAGFPRVKIAKELDGLEILDHPVKNSWYHMWVDMDHMQRDQVSRAKLAESEVTHMGPRGYRLPKLSHVVTCAMLYKLKTGRNILENGYVQCRSYGLKDETCLTVGDGEPVIVGPFKGEELHIRPFTQIGAAPGGG